MFFVVLGQDRKICSKVWVPAIFPCQDHGQIPADAEEVEYPYTKVVGVVLGSGVVGCGLLLLFCSTAGEEILVM